MRYMDFISFLALISRIKTFYKMWYTCNFIEVKRTQSRRKGVKSYELKLFYISGINGEGDALTQDIYGKNKDMFIHFLYKDPFNT